MLDHLLEPTAFCRDVLVLPVSGRLGDAVDVGLVDADELDPFTFEPARRSTSTVGITSSTERTSDTVPSYVLATFLLC
jgi:hypothetical protein